MPMCLCVSNPAKSLFSFLQYYFYILFCAAVLCFDYKYIQFFCCRSCCCCCWFAFVYVVYFLVSSYCLLLYTAHTHTFTYDIFIGICLAVVFRCRRFFFAAVVECFECHACLNEYTFLMNLLKKAVRFLFYFIFRLGTIRLTYTHVH